MALANKYRPNVFSEVIGQDNVVNALKNIIKNQNFWVLFGNIEVSFRYEVYKSGLLLILSQLLQSQTNHEA